MCSEYTIFLFTHPYVVKDLEVGSRIIEQFYNVFKKHVYKFTVY